MLKKVHPHREKESPGRSRISNERPCSLQSLQRPAENRIMGDETNFRLGGKQKIRHPFSWLPFFGGFLSHRGSPSHHPPTLMGFSMK